MLRARLSAASVQGESNARWSKCNHIHTTGLSRKDKEEEEEEKEEEEEEEEEEEQEQEKEEGADVVVQLDCSNKNKI